VRDLAQVDESTLASHVGLAMAASLSAYAIGEDYREVVTEREVKSVGHDQTFARSLEGVEAVLEALKVHAAVVARALPRSRESRAPLRSWCALTTARTCRALRRCRSDSTTKVGIAAIAGALVQSMELGNAVRLLALHASSS